MKSQQDNYPSRNERRSYSAVYLGILLLMATCAGCAAPSINVMKLEPGRSAEAAAFKKIAVLQFDGKGGNLFSSQLEGMLGGIKVNEKQFFEIVNRSAIAKVTEELKLAQSGLVDSSSAAKLGKLIGAKGIYIGSISSDVNDNEYTEGRSRCIQYSSDGKRCVDYEKWMVPCTKRTASFSATPKLVDVGTARVIFSKNYAEKSESSRCSDSSRALASGSELVADLESAVIGKIRKDVAPFYMQIKVQLVSKNKDIASEEAKQQLKNGMAFAQSKRFDRACEIWREAQHLAPNSIAFLHNLAVCAETSGKLEYAHALIMKADKQLLKPDQVVSASLQRIEKSIKSKEKLARQQAD